MNQKLLFMCSTVVVSTCFMSAPVHAQHDALGAAATTAVSLACSVVKDGSNWNDLKPVIGDDGAVEWAAIDRYRLFYFVATQSGALVSKEGAIDRVRSAFENEGNLQTSEKEINRQIRLIITNIQGSIHGGGSLIKAYANRNAEPPNDADFTILDETQSKLWLDSARYFRCPREHAIGQQPTIAGKVEQKKSELKLVLRQTSDALALTGDERKAAPSAQFQLSRERSFLDDGSRKEVTQMGVKGVVGLRLTDNPSTKFYVYSGYELSRSRTIPAAPLVAPATARDGDTEILKFGLSARHYFDLDPDPYEASTSLHLDVSGQYLFDFVKDSERIRTSVIATPYFRSPVPELCGMRYFRPIFIKGLRAKCALNGSFQFNQYVKSGTQPLTANDNFAFAGIKANYDLMFSGDLDAGAFLGASFEYMPALSKGIRDIKRHNIYAKYRWWQGERFAIDFGLDLTDGINPDSFADENKLNLSVGLLF